MNYLEMIDYALEEATGTMRWAWFRFFCFYYLIAAYGEFHYLLPWG